MRLKVAVLAGTLLVGTSALGAGLLGMRTPVVDHKHKCATQDARIVVDLSGHTLALCNKDQLVAAFSIRFGRNGSGKTREGDAKTPVGTYTLGEPRPSKRFGIFIPIDFPTAEQKKKGYTGSAIGVHGPARAVKWLGSLVNTFDSSEGCVGVARDSEIQTIANWVRATSVQTIELL